MEQVHPFPPPPREGLNNKVILDMVLFDGTVLSMEWSLGVGPWTGSFGVDFRVE